MPSESFQSEDSAPMGEDEEATDSPNNFNNKSVWAIEFLSLRQADLQFYLAFTLQQSSPVWSVMTSP